MNRIVKKALLPSLMVLVLVLPLFAALGCGDEGEKTYKIGALFAVTGRNAPLGVPEKNVAIMLEKQINDAGGINGRKLKIIVYDTASDETTCVTLAKKLIAQDKVSAIVGPTSTGESIALIDTVTKNKIPMVSCAASYKIVEPVADRYWVFKTPQSDRLAAGEIFAHAQQQGITKVATICDTAGFGKNGEEALGQEAPKYGITIVTKESYGPEDTDMTTQLTKIKGTNAQAIICWGTNPGPAVIAKNKKTLGIDLPLYNSHGIANQEFITLAGDAANGVIFPAGKIIALDAVSDSDPQKAVLQQLLTDYQAAYNKTPNTFAGYAWDAIQMVVMAMKAVGDNKAKIRDYLENNIKNFPGTGGVFNMSPEDHNGLGPGAFLMVKIVDGKWTAIQ
ncbi:MAG: ABC transporter substrate-binding protein [Chloroflexi bacterium]|nr:ABC transporter substrate-binding protein [Chloroflexota bacterium]